MKRVIRVEKRKELLSLSLIYTNGEVRSFLSAQMSDDHVMSHTRVLSLKEGNTRAEKRGLDSGVSEREREREREAEKDEEEREKGISFPRGFQPGEREGGVEKKGRNDAEEGERGHERGVGGGRMAARVDAVPLLFLLGPISTRA